jgi:hypothetical protein
MQYLATANKSLDSSEPYTDKNLAVEIHIPQPGFSTNELEKASLKILAPSKPGARSSISLFKCYAHALVAASRIQ